MITECEDVIVIDTKNITIPKEGNNLFESRENIAEIYQQGDKPKVSIIVLAYNRLEKTERCVDLILKHSKNVNYELILCDNGSTDETLEFFKKVNHGRKKIIRVTNNLGAGFGGNVAIKITSGKYIIGISNDVCVTPNWLSNLITCIESDERIGMVTPMSSNISNLQDPGLNFSSIEQMEEVAAKFNISDSSKWYERRRLIPILQVYKKEVIDIVGIPDYGFFHDFADDDFSMRICRAGYKQILCGDTFVHHDHDFRVYEDKKQESFQQSLEIGRMNFSQKYYGIDAWDDIANYEVELINLGDFKQNTANRIDILGIDTKCGTPILEMKNKIKTCKRLISSLYAYSTDPKYYNDLLNVCDGNVRSDKMEFIGKYYEKASFDYIIVGKYLNEYENPFSALEQICELANENGQILIKLKNTLDVRTLMAIYGRNNFFHNSVYTHLCINDVADFIKAKDGVNLKKLSCTYHNVDKDLKESIIKSAEKIVDNRESFERVFIDEYLLCIEK